MSILKVDWYYKIMLENSPDNFDTLDLTGLKPRMRTYHMRIKQKKMDLEDYDLSTSTFT